MSKSRTEWHRKRQLAWNRENGCCHYCGLFIADEDRTLDHIVPKAFGGPDANWNLVAACAKCNEAWADSAQKCICGTCKYAVNRFHREKKRTSAAPVIWERRAHRSDDEAAEQILRRINSVKRAIERLPDQNSHDAAAMRGRIRGLREALALLATNSVTTPTQSSDEEMP